jgi:uncharacterized membrane protein YphA (DoxX/SURF4 family)
MTIMKKTHKITYWISTVWLCLAMLSSGIVQLFKVKGEIEFIIDLGYPVYFLTILAIWKILGVVALLIPKAPLVKEWAYAGFFIAMSGAIVSHIASGKPGEIAPALLVLVLTVVSWYFRPPERKVSFVRA